MNETHWPQRLSAITLFSDDLDASRRFYSAFFDAHPIHEDPDSVVFRVGTTLVNLLRVEAVPELIDPAPMATSGVRAVYSLPVPDEDAMCALLRGRGVTLLNGPMDRPWGLRTASVQDPSGHVWELSQ